MSSILDDAQLTFDGQWSHAEDGSANLVEGTQSWTNDPAASFSFDMTGTGFDLCAGLKLDRGAFTYTIDGASHGSGTELGDGTEADPICSTVASVRNLVAGPHSVVFRNAGSSYFAVDAVTIFGGAVAISSTTTSSSKTTSTSSSSSSSSSTSSYTTSTTSSSSSSSPTTSVQVTSSSTSSSSTLSVLSFSSSASAVAAAAAAEHQEAHSGVSSGKKAAMIGGPILAGIILAVLAFFIFTRCKRKREADSVAIAPSASSHYLDEKDDKGGFYGPTEREKERERFSPLHFAGRISPLPFTKARGHNRLNSEMSLESHTEPFQPTSLAQPPYVEPFRLPAGDFDHYRNSNCNPTAPAPVHVLQRQSSYDDRLAAASANLPDWRLSKASDASHYPSTVWDQRTEVDADRLSTYSALYEGLMEEESTESHDPKDRYR